jgi:hypothetical protein
MDEELTSDFLGGEFSPFCRFFKKNILYKFLFLGKKNFRIVNFCFENHHNWLQHERALKIF